MQFFKLILILHTSILTLINANTPAAIPNLSRVNNIEIYFMKGKKDAVYKTTKTIDLTYLKDLVTKAKNQSGINCDTTGKIIYFENNKAVFTVYFCSRGTGSKYYSTGAVIFKVGNQKTTSLLNYGSGMLINEAFYHLNKP